MWYRVHDLLDRVKYGMLHMDRHQWMVVFAVVVVVGAICLRGFGSRTGY